MSVILDQTVVEKMPATANHAEHGAELSSGSNDLS